jgi:hypothetical protein
MRRLQNLRFGLICFGICCWGGISCTNAFSQTRRSDVRQYRPSRETLSPYVGLLQGNNGVIPNYYTLVQPRLEQRDFNQQIQATTRIQALDIQTLSGGAESTPRPVQTGKNAGFQQYLHYYPTMPVTRRRP